MENGLASRNRSDFFIENTPTRPEGNSTPKGTQSLEGVSLDATGGLYIGGSMEPKAKDVVRTGKQVLDKMETYYLLRQEESTNAGIIVGLCLLIAAIIYFVLLMAPMAHAQVVQPARLKASWYSVDSLKREGTWKTSKGVMANGKQFDEKKFTCATRLYPLGSTLRISNKRTGRSVVCKVSDRIGKRFATTRIDLSKSAFQQIAKLEEGLIEVEVTR